MHGSNGAETGGSSRLRNRTPAEIQARFPRLNSGNYRETSHATDRYNCMAFANYDERRWWEPLFGGRFYWPPNVGSAFTLDTSSRIFLQNGYVPTDSSDVEPGFEKVALYEDHYKDIHVAISDGNTWKSKLGAWQDIEHLSLDLLEGDNQYGSVRMILQRKKP